MKPLFIVGVPRSGTTLLREILIRHDLISMPQDELQVIPYLLRRYGKTALSERMLHDIYDVLASSAFSYHYDIPPFSSFGFEVGIEVSELVIRFLKVTAGTDDACVYVGDKTPSNVYHLPLLLSHYPEMKVVNIVRDPRDVCLSMRKAWGKSLLRGACMWRDGISEAAEFEKLFPRQLKTVSYEGLTKHPKETLAEICNFLEVPFQKELIEGFVGREKMGDTAGKSGVVQGNSEKYKNELSEKDIKLVESICLTIPVLGYKSSYATSSYRPSSLRVKVYSFIDFLKSYNRHVKEKGFLLGVIYKTRQTLRR